MVSECRSDVCSNSSQFSSASTCASLPWREKISMVSECRIPGWMLGLRQLLLHLFHSFRPALFANRTLHKCTHCTLYIVLVLQVWCFALFSKLHSVQAQWPQITAHCHFSGTFSTDFFAVQRPVSLPLNPEQPKHNILGPKHTTLFSQPQWTSLQSKERPLPSPSENQRTSLSCNKRSTMYRK